MTRQQTYQLLLLVLLPPPLLLLQPPLRMPLAPNLQHNAAGTLPHLLRESSPTHVAKLSAGLDHHDYLLLLLLLPLLPQLQV
jgi:hypothetical protein